MFLLVAATKGITFKFDGHKHPLYDFHDAKRDFYRYYQMGQTTTQKYLEDFKNKVLVI